MRPSEFRTVLGLDQGFSVGSFHPVSLPCFSAGTAAGQRIGFGMLSRIAEQKTKVFPFPQIQECKECDG